MNPKILELRKTPNNSRKKWIATVKTSDGKIRTVQFGAKGYSDYTIHMDRKRRELYRLRHQKDLKAKNADGMLSPGYLSYFLLWGPSTNLDTNLANFNRMLAK